MLLWLENTPIALWVSLSYWAYPLLLSVHIIGLSVVAGLFSMRDLRALGIVRDPPLSLFLRYHRLALVGLVLNFISGLLLFSSQATVLIESIPFVVKMVCVAMASAVAFILDSRLNAAGGYEVRGLKWLAGLSLCLWMSAIVAGRLIAYIF